MVGPWDKTVAVSPPRPLGQCLLPAPAPWSAEALARPEMGNEVLGSDQAGRLIHAKSCKHTTDI